MREPHTSHVRSIDVEGRQELGCALRRFTKEHLVNFVLTSTAGTRACHKRPGPSTPGEEVATAEGGEISHGELDLKCAR